MVKKRTPHIWHFSFQFYKNARVNFYVPWLNNLPHFPLISDIHPQSLKKETFYTNTSKQMLLGCINSGRRTPLTRLACNPKCGVSCNFFIKKTPPFLIDTRHYSHKCGQTTVRFDPPVARVRPFFY